MISHKIHLIRTGSTSANAWKRYVGQTDLPLCDKGLDALEGLRGEFIYPAVDLLFSSPLRRCLQTAELLYPEMDAIVADGFKDMHLGEFEGKTFEELSGDGAFSAWLDNSFENPPPGGEDTGTFTYRIVDALDHVYRRMMNESVTSAAVVTHGGVIMTLLAAIGLPKAPLHHWAVANGAGYTLMMNAGMWMRDRASEVYGFVPDQVIKDELETDGLYGE